MNLTEKNKLDLIEHNIKKSQEANEEVKFLISNGFYALALTRTYYSIFYMISALALQYDFSTANHSQLIGWFNKTFVKDNKVASEIGKKVYLAFEQRTKSDYNVLAQFTKEDAEKGLANLNFILPAVRNLINSR
ncbi:MAG: HEPN domain-containing protein [Candidatus Cloacimonadales bacterium]|nr:HEPN domain-containing protein [Candidatus Cloacimonadales bacterium]